MSHPRADLEHEVCQLKDRVHLLESMVRHSRDLLFTLDDEGRIIAVNEAVEGALHYPESDLLGRPFDELIAPGSLWISGTQFETVLKSRCGIGIRVEISRDRRILIARDLRYRETLEGTVRQAHKMETLGVLAAGIAHDFNNLLTGILGYAYLLQNEPDVTERYGEAIDVIVKSSERAAQLTTQLLGFARQNKSPLAPVDLHHTIRDIVQLLNSTIDKRIHVSAHLLASRSRVLADASQMYQLFLNLCLNARDAMPNGGELRVTSRNSGRGVVVSVSDTGLGIPEEIRSRIFEPFFTTKESARGTGMGLAMVQAITRNHGGAVSLESRPNQGSVFHITLPTCAAPTPTVPDAPACQKGSGNVFVIEQEEFVGQVLTRMLSGMGYNVTCATDVLSALHYFRGNYKNIDLVILDFGMPGMNGMECLQALRSIDPNVKAILSSGHGNGIDEEVEVLPKPYQPEQLAEIVQRAIQPNQVTASLD